MRSEDTGYLREHTWFIDHTQSQVKSGNDALDRQTFSIQTMRRKPECFAAGIKPDRCLCQIADHRAGSRILTGAATIEKRVTDNVTMDHQRVKHAVD